MSRRVVARIVGGIGNQLFCYAAARRLALKNSASLVLDVDFFRSDINYGREYRLDCFALAPHEVLSSSSLLPAWLDHRWWRVKRKLAAYGLIPGRDWLIERNHAEFEPRILSFDVTRTVLLDGYWQDERYFADIGDILRRDLVFRLDADTRQHEMAARIAESNAVAVHCRRLQGSTLSNPSGAVESLNSSYYLNAIETLADRVPHAEFFCFGDDPRWLMEHWPANLPVTVVHNSGRLGELTDLWLMSMCRHFIIANSSFSWWGAWLGATPGKIVIAPRSQGLPYQLRSAAGWIELSW